MLTGKTAVIGAFGLCAVTVCAGVYATLPGRQTVEQLPIKPVRCTAPQTSAQPVPDLPLRKLIGQLLVLGFSGTAHHHPWPALLASQLRQGEIGGVLFLGKNVSTAERTKELISFFRSQPVEFPPFFMIDQEGGRVQRLGPRVGVERLPSAKVVAQEKTEQEARALYNGSARLLSAWGLNTNLGPVADVNVNPSNPVIARLKRSYSTDASKVAAYAAAFVQAHRDAGILTALKHFPGHGSSLNDSHRGLTDISASWQKERELAPFAALAKGGCADMVMTGHLVLKSYGTFAGSAAPATFSNRLVTEELRTRMEFDGVVITDDLDMGAIRRYYTLEQSLTGAIRAGHDILLHSNIITADRDLPRRAIDILHAEALRDPEFERSLRRSFERVWALKSRLKPAPGAQALSE